GWGVCRGGRLVSGGAVRSRCRRPFSVVVRRAAAILIGDGRLPRPGLVRSGVAVPGRGRAFPGGVRRAAAIGALKTRGTAATGRRAATVALAAPGAAAA